MKNLDDAIERSAACGYEAAPFLMLIIAARHTRNLRACLRARDWTAFANALIKINESRGDHRMIVPANVTKELGVMQLILECHNLEVKARSALQNRQLSFQSNRNYRNFRYENVGERLGESEITDEWATSGVSSKKETASEKEVMRRTQIRRFKILFMQQTRSSTKQKK